MESHEIIICIDKDIKKKYIDLLRSRSVYLLDDIVSKAKSVGKLISEIKVKFIEFSDKNNCDIFAYYSNIPFYRIYSSTGLASVKADVVLQLQESPITYKFDLFLALYNAINSKWNSIIDPKTTNVRTIIVIENLIKNNTEYNIKQVETLMDLWYEFTSQGKNFFEVRAKLCFYAPNTEMYNYLFSNMSQVCFYPDSEPTLDGLIDDLIIEI